MRTKLVAVMAAFTLALSLGAAAGCSDDDVGEICDNGVDDDGDGLADCDDPLCDMDEACQPVCGDGVAEGDEVCDTNDLAGNTCASEGFDDGDLACNATCDGFDDSACYDYFCGDDAAEGTEECDGVDLANTTCEDLGYLGGDLACDTDCFFDESGCFDTVTCSDASFMGTGGQAFGGDSQNGNYDWLYQELVDLGDGATWLLSIELYGDFVNGGGGITTGAHDVSVPPEDNYATCAYCVLMRRCADAQCSNVEAVFFPTAGTLQLDVLSQAGMGSFQGSISDFNWEEVTIDSSTYESTAVVGGDCFNLTAAYTVDATVDAM